MASNQINNEYVQKGYLKTYLANRGVKVVNYDEWEHLCDCIDDAKPADVRENVRGKWKLLKNGDAICSECGFTQVSAWDMDNWDNFCHHCGADMRERKS